MPSLERELRFIDNTVEVYEPYGNLLGSAEYTFEGYGSQGGDLFRIEQTTSIEGSYYLFGTVIPCNSELVFYLSDIDRSDRFYRKVESSFNSHIVALPSCKKLKVPLHSPQWDSSHCSSPGL